MNIKKLIVILLTLSLLFIIYIDRDLIKGKIIEIRGKISKKVLLNILLYAVVGFCIVMGSSLLLFCGYFITPILFLLALFILMAAKYKKIKGTETSKRFKILSRLSLSVALNSQENFQHPSKHYKFNYLQNIFLHQIW